ncbi:MAG: signal peptidase II [Parvularcula sp.]
MIGWFADARRNRRFHLTLAVAGAALLLDQLTKAWILYGLRLREITATLPDGTVRVGHVNLGPVFDLTYVENRGVSFGLFAGGLSSRILLSLLAIGVAGAVVHWAGRLERTVAAVGAGFIVGGALGNAIDRISYGYVVDFLDFSGLWFPWQFNIADAAINLGVACLAYDAFFVTGGKTGGGAPGAGDRAMLEGDRPQRAPKDDGNFTSSNDG